MPLLKLWYTALKLSRNPHRRRQNSPDTALFPTQLRSPGQSTMATPENAPLVAAAAPSPRRLKSRAVVAAAALLSFGLGAVALSVTAPKNKDTSSLAVNVCDKCTTGPGCFNPFLSKCLYDYDQEWCSDNIIEGTWCSSGSCGTCNGCFNVSTGVCFEDGTAPRPPAPDGPYRPPRPPVPAPADYDERT